MSRVAVFEWWIISKFYFLLLFCTFQHSMQFACLCFLLFKKLFSKGHTLKPLQKVTLKDDYTEESFKAGHMK